MPSINMIAPRRTEKRRLLANMQRLAVVILVELVFLVGVGFWAVAKVQTTKSQIRQVDEQIKKLDPVVKQRQEYDALTGKLEPRRDLLDQAKDRTMRWYNTLDRLTQSLPQSTWLTRMGSRSDSNAGTVTVNLSGMSISQANVGEAMIRLQAIPDFKTINLEYTQKSMQGDSTAIEFQINAAMKGDEQPKGGTTSGTSQS